MAEEHRFDWGAIFRACGIIAGISAAYALIVPIAGAFIDGNANTWTTQTVAGHEIYQWVFWALAWGLTVWQGAWMIRHVHERIIDDMLVTSVLCAIVLMIVRFIVWAIYAPVRADGPIWPVTGIDAGGALILIVVALVAARINRY